MDKNDSDLAQFNDMAEFQDRRHEVTATLENCERDDCPNIFILERRVDRHRDELDAHMKHIEELKVMVKANGEQVAKNSVETSAILEIVTMGKSFFKVADWLGTKVVGLAALIGAIVSAVLWLRPGGKP